MTSRSPAVALSEVPARQCSPVCLASWITGCSPLAVTLLTSHKRQAQFQHLSTRREGCFMLRCLHQELH